MNIIDAAIIGGLSAIFGLLILLELRSRNQGEQIDLTIEQLEQNLAQVLQILLTKVDEISQLKDYIPEFSINQNPLQPLIEAFIGNLTSNQPLRTEQPQRGEGGKWIHGTESETESTQTVERD